MAESAACEAALPLLQAALSATGGLIPPDFSGRVLLNINDAAGLIFSVQGGSAVVAKWNGGASLPVDTTIRFDSVESLRKALQDQRAVPVLLMRRKLRLHGDMSLMAQLGSGDVSSSNSTALAKEFTRELDAAIGASTPGHARSGARAATLRRESVASVASVETCTTWVPNEASPCCQECGKTFTAIWRRHHCRFCGRLLCSRCAPKVQVEDSKDCLSIIGQPRRGVRRCASCTAEAEGVSVPQAPPALPSRRESLFSVTESESAVEAAMERLHALKEEVKVLRTAEQRRLELSVQKGFWQIWLVTYAMIALCTLLLFMWRISFLAAWVAALFVLQKSSEASLLQRNVRVFWSAAVVTVSLLSTRYKLRSLNLTEGEDYRAEWDATNEVLARFLYQQILKLKGFWIKLGQQLSVNVMMAPAFRTEFGKLQDKIPPMPARDVKLTLLEEFGPEVASTIHIDEKEPPLGTASIAQVHRAIWKPKGQAHKEIVVKVQHRNVAQQFNQDLRNANILSKLLALVDPEGVPDLRPIVQSLREVTVNELDFRKEAENQARALEAAEKHRAKVLIPKVVPELVSRRAMAMDYVHGEPLSKASERLTQEQRNRLIGAMVDHFAVQFALDGHFHADPHPGNLLVQTGTDRLVVLDWGMCITLPPSKVNAYAQLFVAAATSNPWRLMDALRGIGISFRDGDVFEPVMFLNFIRFALREAQPAEEAKGQVENFMKAGDDLYQRGPKRFKKSPFDVITGDMTYFLKALDLLWCVSSQLHTRHPILESMFLRTLAKGSGSVPRSPAELLPPVQRRGRRGRALEDRLVRLLEEFYRRGDLLGAQLTVVRGGAVLADLALGVTSWMEQEPVTSETFFNLLDISKMVAAFAAWHLPRHDVLPGLEVTLEQVLSHRSGYWTPLASGLMHLSELQNMDTVLKALTASKAEAAGEQCYHSFSFGYLLAAAFNYAQSSFAEAWEAVCRKGADMASALKMEAPALQLTLPLRATAAQLEGDVTTQDFEEVAEMIGYAYAVLGEGGEGSEEERSGANGAASGTNGARNAIEASRRDLFGREHLLDRSLFNLPETQSCIMPGLQSFGTSRGLCGLLVAMAQQMPEDALKSRRGGSVKIQDLAEELKPLLSLEAFDDFALGVQLVHSSFWEEPNAPREPREPDASPGLESLESFLGTSDVEAQASSPPAWGHLSQNGSFALVLPTQEPLVVSLLLNKCGRKQSGHKVAKSVLRAIHKDVAAR